MSIKINELQKSNSTPVSLVENGNNNGNPEAREMLVDCHEPMDIAEKLGKNE